MTTDELIRELSSWVQDVGRPKKETVLHNATLKKLKTLNVKYDNKPPIPNPEANGESKPDILVTGVAPQLLIEIKVDGDWEYGSKAAWQLFQAAELLQGSDILTRKLAIFGSKFNDPILPKMLEALGIEWACGKDPSSKSSLGSKNDG